MSIDPTSIPLEELDGAVEGLRNTFYQGKTTSFKFRMKQLLAFKKMLVEGGEELEQALKADLGKAPFESQFCEIIPVKLEVQWFIDHLADLMKPAKKSLSILATPGYGEVVSDPLGLVLILGAWNYPVQLTLSPLVGAIAAGNCAVLRPANYARHTSNAISRLLKRYLDNDCYKVVEGDRHTTTAVLAHRWDLIFFTGGTFVGRLVAQAAAKHLTPCVLEMGGKSPAIVDHTASLDVTLNRLVWGKFTNAGQTCIAPDFVMVHEKIADKFIAGLKKKIVEFYSQDASKTEWFGRIINARAKKRLVGLIEASQEYMVHGGVTESKVEGDELFIEPTVLDFGTDKKAFLDSPVMQDEIFGPILPVYRYSNLSDVLGICRAREREGWKPLVQYVFSNDSSNIKLLKSKTTSGAFLANECLLHVAEHELPFGGVGNSGLGAYHGRASWDCFTHQKSVMVRPSYGDIPLRYPPFTNSKQSALNVVIKFLLLPHWKTNLISKAILLLVSVLGIKFLFPIIKFVLSKFR